MKKKTFGLLVILFVCAAIVSLFTVQTQAAKVPKDILVFASTDSITTWDPSAAYSTESSYMPNIYETLIWVSPPGSKEPFQPGLAKKWEVNSTGLEWTFYLRKGVKFHDGGILTAQAVKDSIERTIKMKKGASFIFSPVKEIKVIDDYRVKFILKKPAPFDRIIASANAAWIISPKAVHKDRKWFDAGHEAGCGPYILESWKPDEEIIFKRFDDYWRGWKGPHFNRIVVKIVKEATVAEQMLESGVADLVTRIPIESSKILNTKKCCERLVGPSFMNYAIHLNTAKFPFNNKLIRKAASYATPYKKIIEVALGGLGRQAVGPVPYGQFGHDETLPQYTYDLEKARKLMTQAGHPKGIKEKVMFTYASENAVEKAFAPLIREEFAKIGIQVDIRPMNWTAQWDLMKGGPEKAQDMAALLWWPTFSDPYETLYSLWHVEKKPYWNFSYYKNPEFDETILQAYSTPDSKKAQALYSKAQRMLIEDAPSIFLADVQRPVFKSRRLKGYIINPNYPRVAFWYYMYKE
ncbi:MAG: ABC transporter substrate-binding protein [Deltaproteobacteria bacterium]|nr:ABC transporter substrate-binding protein [Deltaproteobacteria bacterium]MBW2082807.1 ABC transporter substrate-binding protein [Deltaproteobacteria bacterium]HDM10368.1 ABC transporter substrate-binding protein [Desulfobacteraceae bacterium]